jgi:hypothetical protein
VVPVAQLSAANRRALAHARERAEQARVPVPGELLAAVREARVTLNFHPDRLLADGRTVAGALLEEGVYRSQFETRISGGGLTAHPGGDRDRWERDLFGGAYDEAPAAERPRYGGLNLLRHLNGACPGFGSCHLRLRPAALERTTFTWGDSNTEPTHIGVIDAFEPVLAPLLEETGDWRGAEPALTHDLTHYVEAQVHGVVALAEDVEAVVIDPSFGGEQLIAAAERYGLAAEWQPPIELPLERIPAEAPEGAVWEWEHFCAGGHARALAERVTGGAPLDAASIGRAAVAGEHDPQQLKYLWRMTVAYGG